MQTIYGTFDEGVADKVISWKRKDPKFRRLFFPTTPKDQPMQRQFTLEMRVTFQEDGKAIEFRKAMAAAGRNLLTVAALLDGTCKPEIAMYSDDFYKGHEEIQLMEDAVAKGVELVGGGEDPGVSQAMLDALRDN